MGIAPASAAEEERLELSADGQGYSRSLDAEFFADQPDVVPGEAVNDEFWIRNGADESADAGLFITSSGSSIPAEARNDQFQISVQGTDLEKSIPLLETSNCLGLGRVSLAPGEQQRVEVSVGLPLGAGEIAESQRASLGFRVTLQPAHEEDPPCVEGSSPPPASDGGAGESPQPPGSGDGAGQQGGT